MAPTLYAGHDQGNLFPMKLADIPQLKNAPISSKLEIVEELWADIIANASSVPLPEWHVRELDESLADYRSNPNDGLPWSEIRDRLRKEP